MNKLTATIATWSTLPLRLVLGAIMIAHGAQKVLGVSGGRGFSAWIAGQPPFDFMRPAWFWLGVAAFSEFIGGMMIVIGLYTRLAAFLIACTMATAVFGVHFRNGFFLSQGGYEFALALLGIAVSLMIIGGGNASADQKLR